MVEYLRDAVQKNGCSVPIYCFMPDHLHLIIKGETEAADTWRAMVKFKQKSGHWFAKLRPWIGWQHSFYDHVLRSDTSLHNAIVYIANNPVRLGLVRRWNDYPFIGSIGRNLQDIL
jgi:putative transposase